MTLLCILLQVYSIVVIARIILEWIPISYDHPLARLRSTLRAATEPVLAPIRGLVPPVRMGGVALDLSPIILFILLGILIGVVC